MGVESADHSNLPRGGATVVRFFWWTDRIVLWLGALPLMIVTQTIVGGLRGFVIGFSAGFGLWLLYRVAKLIFLRVFTRFVLSLDREVIAICDEASLTGDEHVAAARLDELISTRGETFDRMLALTGFLTSTKQMDRAIKCCDRAKAIATADQLWRVQCAEAEWLRKNGRLQEAHDSALQAVRSQPYSSGARVEYALALAELGRKKEAEAELREARRLCGSRVLRFIVGGTYLQLVRKEVEEAERFVARHG